MTEDDRRGEFHTCGKRYRKVCPVDLWGSRLVFAQFGALAGFIVGVASR